VFDFRYHALSLVAVFLALAIGIVLGVTIGDSLLSDAERSLRTNLRSDVTDARNDASKARAERDARDRMLDQLYPALVRDRLRGERVAVISWGALPNDVEGGVRDAIHRAGGRIDSVSVFDEPLSLLRRALGRSRFNIQTVDESSLEDLGVSLADGIVLAGGLGTKLREDAPDEFAGRFTTADAVVFYEAPTPGDSNESKGNKEREDDRARTIEQSMLDELRKRTIAVVGVESSSADPSQIPRYQSLELSTVDSIDKSGGRIGLVFALGGAEGNFGFKSTAKQPLPDEATLPSGESP